MGTALKVLVIAISIVALVGSSLSCDQGDTQAAERGALDRVVPRLPNGLSIHEVEERLGEPHSRVENEDSEVVLNYGLWRVVFHPSLYVRIRWYAAGHRLPDTPAPQLDREVRALELGSSRRTVERELGKTEGWEILTYGSREHLWYGDGRWELHFTDRRLSGKVLYK